MVLICVQSWLNNPGWGRLNGLSFAGRLENTWTQGFSSVAKRKAEISTIEARHLIVDTSCWGGSIGREPLMGFRQMDGVNGMKLDGQQPYNNMDLLSKFGHYGPSRSRDIGYWLWCSESSTFSAQWKIAEEVQNNSEGSKGKEYICFVCQFLLFVPGESAREERKTSLILSKQKA